MCKYRWGCDTIAIIGILAHRDASQRALIEQEYKVMYSEDLNKRLSAELTGDVKLIDIMYLRGDFKWFQKALLLWMPDPARRDAMILREALSNNIDLKAITEVLCSRTPTQLYQLKQLYIALFGVYLEHDIQSQTSGDHKKVIFISLVSFNNMGYN
uniref:Annexin n=1 Tax=Lactuca sativa TaxID=4236 RepID=A0A9R1W582_LACSA|nr:hypothetical protein LSAT_V11C300144330 [Lactuca sativa]